MVVESIDREVKVVVESLDCFGVEVEDWMIKGRWVASMERSKWLWRSWILFSMMMVLQKMRAVFVSEEWVEVPGLMAQDRRKVKKVVEGLMYCLVKDGISVSEIHRPL